MDKNIVIIGSGGHAKSVINVASSCGFSVIALVDDTQPTTHIMDIPVINKQQCLELYSHSNIAIAIGNNIKRQNVYCDYKNALPHAHFPSLVHATSVLGVYSSIGEATIVMPFANIGPNSIIGDCCILNTSSSIDHDGVMADFSSLAPGVICGGTVTIGQGTAISIGATVKNNITIGPHTIIGAKSYVNKNIGDNVVAYGCPCKIIRKRDKGNV